MGERLPRCNARRKRARSGRGAIRARKLQASSRCGRLPIWPRPFACRSAENYPDRTPQDGDLLVAVPDRDERTSSALTYSMVKAQAAATSDSFMLPWATSVLMKRQHTGHLPAICSLSSVVPSALRSMFGKLSLFPSTCVP